MGQITPPYKDPARVAAMLAEGCCPACSGTGAVPRDNDWARPDSTTCAACGGNGQAAPGMDVEEWLGYVRCCEGAETMNRIE